jgi:hypothetical protein
MERYCTTAWVLALVNNSPTVLAMALSSAMVVAASPRLPLFCPKMVAVVAITALHHVSGQPANHRGHEIDYELHFPSGAEDRIVFLARWCRRADSGLPQIFLEQVLAV